MSLGSRVLRNPKRGSASIDRSDDVVNRFEEEFFAFALDSKESDGDCSIILGFNWTLF